MVFEQERERERRKEGREEMYRTHVGCHVFGNVFFCGRMNALHVCDDTCCYLMKRPECVCPVSGRRRRGTTRQTGEEEGAMMMTTDAANGEKRSRGGGVDEMTTMNCGNQTACHNAGLVKRMRT